MSTLNLSIIIPAYNESKNLELLIPNIFRVIPESQIIIVDDSTGDEKMLTHNLINKLNSKHITLMQRGGKDGRGSAVLLGMKKALENKKTAIIIEMDADLAHDPNELPMLISKITSADMVIGSRYITGSNIIDWPQKRLIQSKIINFFLTYWLGLHITDYTNGFRAYTRKACEYLTSIKLYEKGFISLSEIAYKLTKKRIYYSRSSNNVY